MLGARCPHAATLCRPPDRPCLLGGGQHPRLYPAASHHHHGPRHRSIRGSCARGRRPPTARGRRGPRAAAHGESGGTRSRARGPGTVRPHPARIACAYGPADHQTRWIRRLVSMSTLYEELSNVIEGEVRFDPCSRALYSTDASMYQIEPIGVIIPKHRGDVIATLDIARRNQVPVLPRGGGTSLAGQTVGQAVVMDFSKFMHQILEVNATEGWARVQPGVIQDEFNAHLRPLGFLFGPDTSTSNRATIGGMIGNNSAGSHSIAYGKTIDHVLELSVVLSDASTTVLKAMDKAALEAKCQGGTLEHRIYRAVTRIVGANRDEIHKRYPMSQRRVSGYNLDAFVRNGAF